MCGIVGFISKKNFENFKNDFFSAADSLTHRGPDDNGFFFDSAAGVGLAHRRLSIIDLSSAGRQPMTSDDGSVQIIFNGEIYNFLSLKKTLAQKGHQFQTLTDTEVILKAYIEWGMGCLQRLIGMFAFAIWDSNDRKLYLARDRIGKKPVYYHFDSGTLLFASELKAMMAFRTVSLEIDPEAIPLFLHYQYIPGPRTVFKKTFKLLPGHFLSYNGTTIREERYWDFPAEAPFDSTDFNDEKEVLSQLDRLLTQTVRDRLISDVPIGALLSGGIDSSVVVALMQKINTVPIRTFSIGFNERGYNEAHWAALVAKHLGTNHTELYVNPRDALEVISALPEIYDEPFADSSAVPTYLVCKLARSQVTVALSGDGGDEQFCGYVRYWSTQSLASTLKFFPDNLRKIIALLLKRLPANWVEKCYLPFRAHLPQRFQSENFTEKWQRIIELMDHMTIRQLYRLTISLWSQNEICELMGRSIPIGQYEKAFASSGQISILSRLMRVDQKTYLPDAMLVKIDRASMANSLEIRAPLLDHRVVEFSAAISDALKFRNGTGKYILKKLLCRYVPEAYINRPKMGFAVPVGQWLRSDLREILLDYLSPEALKQEGIFNSRLIERMISDHLSGTADHQYRLWALLMWEMWRKYWIG